MAPVFLKRATTPIKLRRHQTTLPPLMVKIPMTTLTPSPIAIATRYLFLLMASLKRNSTKIPSGIQMKTDVNKPGP